MIFDRLVTFYQYAENSVWLRNTFASLLLILILFIVRHFIVRHIRSRSFPLEVKRRWLVQLRNAAVLLFIVGLCVIWAAELRTVALSFVAIAAAVVLATKELLMCMSGALLRRGPSSFSLGDRIEVGEFRGDVIDMGLLTTTLLEVGPGQAIHQRTGRAVVLPNSIFLTTAVINETFTDEYVLHVLTIPLEINENIDKVETFLLHAAKEECKDFIEKARAQQKQMAMKHGFDTPNVDPRVTIRMTELGRIELLLRFPVSARKRGRIEQLILRRFLHARTQISQI